MLIIKSRNKSAFREVLSLLQNRLVKKKIREKKETYSKKRISLVKPNKNDSIM
jgi:hypothetical protein